MAERVRAHGNMTFPGTSYTDQVRQPIISLKRLSPEQIPAAQGGSVLVFSLALPPPATEVDVDGNLTMAKGRDEVVHQIL